MQQGNTMQPGNTMQQKQPRMKTNKHYFTCEQLFYYKGIAVDKKPYIDRLNLLLEMFTDHVEQLAITTTTLVVGIPVMTETYEEALTQLEQLPYKTYGVAIPKLKTNPVVYTQRPLPLQAPPLLMPMPLPVPLSVPMPMPLPVPLPVPLPDRKPFNKTFFKIKAGLAADNYHLYTAENTLYDTALVPTYKSSVLLNTLFRSIKENANLDLLEESDDEEEFENTQIDKFVDLEKTVIMECVYSKRFKKWQPLKIAPPNSKITSAKELMQINYK